jgi:4-carboxymuconolactone decarboxylase
MADPAAAALGRDEATLVALAAAIATRDPVRVEVALASAGREASAAAIEEVILQAHLFVGFPDALEALAAWRRLSGSAAPARAADDEAVWLARGERVCGVVYGRNYARLRTNVRVLHPDLDQWMVHGGYGRVLGRPSLALRLRELCTVALLAVWNAPRQLHSHLRGALNAGASAAEVDEAIERACQLLDAARADEVRALWNEVRRAAVPIGAY